MKDVQRITSYDYLVAGTGLYAATFAHQATRLGKTCLLLDKRPHIAGNAHTHDSGGIQVHKYGAHIFHTNNKAIWDYINQFADFNNYINTPIARIGHELYNLPFNMNTFNKLWGVITPAQAMAELDRQRECYKGEREPANLEEQALSLVGRDIYEKLIKGYTEKQWGRPCKDLPASIIKRIPLRFTYDNNYFNDRYQGIPIGGYTKMIEKMLQGCHVLLNTDYFDFIKQNPKIATTTIFTGPIDAYFQYCYGPLEYRSLKFETETLPEENFQGNAVVNYTSKDIPYTRIIEHKHFEFGQQSHTVVTREYPASWQVGQEPYYPINDAANTALYNKYKKLANAEKNVYFGGRLGQYAYLDMDKTIASALELAEGVIQT